MHEPPIILDLPPGPHGLQFSKTIPTEIRRIDEQSPIFEPSLQRLGRLACYLSIPNILDIYGPLDNETVENILKKYPNVEHRKIMFQQRGMRGW